MDLLNLEHDLHVELVELSHFFFLEVGNRLLRLCKLLSDSALSLLCPHTVLLEDQDVVLDLVLLYDEVHALIAEPLDFVNLEFFLGEAGNASIIILVLFLLLFLLLFGLTVFFVVLLGVLLYLLLLLALFNHSFEVGANLVVLAALRIAKLVELRVEGLLLNLDLVDFVLLHVELLFYFADGAHNFYLGVAALLELRTKLLVSLLHALKNDEFLKKQNQLEICILEVGLEAVLLLLHLMDFGVELVDERVNFSAQLVFLELQLNHHNLLVLVVELAFHFFVVFTFSNHAEIGIFMRQSFFLGGCLVAVVLLGVFGGLGSSSVLLFLLFLGGRGSSLLLLAALFGLSCVNFALLLERAILFNLFVGDVKELLGNFSLLVDGGQDQLLRRGQLAIDLGKAVVESGYMRDDVFLAQLQLVDLGVKVNFEFVDGALEQHHLLALFLGVDLHVLRHLVVVTHLEIESAVGRARVFDLFLVRRGLPLVHVLLLKQFFDFLFAGLTLNFAFLALAFGVALVLRGSAPGSGPFLHLRLESGLGVFLVLFVFFEVHGFFAGKFLLHHALKLLDVFVEELGHLRYAEGGNVGACAHRLDGEFFEVKLIVELLLQLVQTCSVVGLGPGDLLGSFLSRSEILLFEEFEVLGIDVEIVVAQLDNLIFAFVNLGQLGELSAQFSNLCAHTFLFSFSQLESVVFLSAELALLDRVDSWVQNVNWRLSKATQRHCKHSFVQTVDAWVDLGKVRLIFLLEISDFLFSNFLKLLLRHVVDAFHSLEGLHPGLLQNHVLVNRVG